MREPVPDIVAQEFLKHFLVAFSSGQSLHLAVREARQRLENSKESIHVLLGCR
jgi:cysteine sulfinate desulfinase/cysteine desulfurase-like protein